MTSAAAEPRALVDGDRDRLLRRDGFVTFPLLDAPRVAEVRAIFERVHGWEGEGFHADLTIPDPDYRRQVNEALAGALAGTVTPLFLDHEPFLYNFVCKFPGVDSELYLHRDWMYVDERAGHRTYVAWIALEDIRGDNGRLRVLRGSHRLDRSWRGTDLGPPWLQHQDTIRERLRSVRVRAGDCVVFNNALLHCSYPNLTDRPRLVAAVGMKPKGAPLVHFRREDAATAQRFDVDETFFCELTPQDLTDAPPPSPPAEQVPDNQLDLTADELAALLDGNPLVVRDRLARRAAGLPTTAIGLVRRVGSAR
jgi:hypothetical protein